MATQAAFPACQDSPLSITGNIVGIITFVYVLTIGLSYRVTAIARAEADIRNMRLEIAVRSVNIGQWQKAALMIGAGPAATGVLKSAETEMVRLEDLSRSIIHPGGLGKRRWYAYWLSWRFIRNRDKLRESLDRVDVLLASSKALAEYVALNHLMMLTRTN